MAEQSVQVVNELRVRPSAPILRPFHASYCFLKFILAQYLYRYLVSLILAHYLRKYERAKGETKVSFLEV